MRIAALSGVHLGKSVCLKYSVTMDRSPKRSPRFSQVQVLIFLLLTMWFGSLAVAPFEGMIVPVATGLALILALKWRSLFSAIVFVSSPLVVFFSLGMVDWFSDRPVLQGMGLPGIEYSNLDRQSRCYRATGGCRMTGTEWVHQSPHNLGLRLMCEIFGSPGNAYEGPYPTMSEIIQLTGNAPRVPTADFLKGKFKIRDRSIDLGASTPNDLIGDLNVLGTLLLALEDAEPAVFADLYQQRCLMIRVRTNPSKSLGIPESDGIYLFDADRLIPFARIVIKGNAPRIPRLLGNFQ